MATLEDALAEANRNNRVCPQPSKWQQLYELLPARQRIGNGWQPALPLILAAWWDTPDLLKIARLQEHLNWAAAHGALDAVYAFLCTLPESEWHHLGE